MGSGMKWLLNAVTILVTCSGVDEDLSVYKACVSVDGQSPVSGTTSLGRTGEIWAKEWF